MPVLLLIHDMTTFNDILLSNAPNPTFPRFNCHLPISHFVSPCTVILPFPSLNYQSYHYNHTFVQLLARYQRSKPTSKKPPTHTQTHPTTFYSSSSSRLKWHVPPNHQSTCRQVLPHLPDLQFPFLVDQALGLVYSTQVLRVTYQKRS